MRTILFLVFMIVFIVALSNIAVIVERSNGIPDILQHTFPEKFVNQEDVTAIETGYAPFAQAENAARPAELHPEIKYDPLGDSIVVSRSLDMPHRHESAVSAWIQTAVAKALTFQTDGYDQHRGEIDEFMSPAGMAEFQKFIEDTKALALMQTRHFELKSFVTDIPKLATSGVAQNRYRWLYDVPVNMTFLPVGTSNYEDLTADQYVSERLNLRIQIGRVAEGGLEGMEIETWEILRPR